MKLSLRKIIISILFCLLVAIILYTVLLIEKEKRKDINTIPNFLIHKEQISLTNRSIEDSSLETVFSIIDQENDIQVRFEYFPHVTDSIVKDIYQAIHQSLKPNSRNIVKVTSITEKSIEFEYWNLEDKEIIKHII